jgi:hypothetical protein
LQIINSTINKIIINTFGPENIVSISTYYYSPYEVIAAIYPGSSDPVSGLLGGLQYLKILFSPVSFLQNDEMPGDLNTSSSG